MAAQMYKGSLGKHDWVVADPCEDGFLTFVDDRPLSYRRSLEEAISLAFQIIARLKNDGDYRLNDKPQGFLPPEFQTHRVPYHSLAELYPLWDRFQSVKTWRYRPETWLYTDAPFLHFRKGSCVQDIERWFEGRNRLFIVEELKSGKRVLDEVALEADFDRTVFWREKKTAEQLTLAMPKSLLGRLVISEDNPTALSERLKMAPLKLATTQEEADFLVDLHALIEEATDAALIAGCLTVQKAIGVNSGDLAGVFFSAATDREVISNKFAQYILAELTKKASVT